MRLLFTTCFLAALLLTASAGAQITILNDNIPSPGTISRTASIDNLNGSILNTLLSGGNNETFDFSALTYSELTPSTVVSAATAPYSDSFPTATYATLTTQGSSNNDTAWSYTRSDADVFVDLGRVTRVSGFGDIVQTYDLKTPDIHFPIDYSDQWTSIRESSSNSFGVDTDVYDTTFYDVDGWGTAVYNSQSRSCLRVSFVERITTISTFNGMPISNTTDSLVGAFFFGPSFEYLAIVEVSYVGGSPSYFSTMSESFAGSPTDVRETGGGSLPEEFALSQNYPNPFNPTTEIEFNLPSQSHMRLEVFNLLGQSVKVLVDQPMAAGTYTASWNATDHNGATVASGIYFYRLTTGSQQSAKKMVLLK